MDIKNNTFFIGVNFIKYIINNFKKNNTETFSIQVIDKGMELAGIYLDDFLTVILNSEVKNGEIAVVRLSDKIYVRRLFYVDGYIRLETSLDGQNPLIIESTTPNFEIIGKVQSLIRAI